MNSTNKKIGALLCLLISSSGLCKNQSGVFNTMYDYFFHQNNSQEKQSLATKKQVVIHENMPTIKIEKNKTKTKSTQKINASEWQDLNTTIRSTGYYSVTGNEKIEKLREDLWYAQSPWPFAARNYLKRDHLEIEVGASFADRAFFNHDPRCMSALIFGKKTVQLQDFLLISRLLKNGNIDLVAGSGSTARKSIANIYKHYAEQEIDFKTSFNSQTVNINYARHWLDGHLSVGMQVPIVRKSHRFNLCIPRNDKLETDLYFNKAGSPDNANFPSIEAREAFFAQHPLGVESLVEEIFEQKNIRICGRNHNDNVGCGDISFFLNGHYSFAYCQEANLGFQITLPIAKTRKLDTLWAPDLGNGGFIAFTGHAGFQWHSNSDLLNPHIYSQLTVFMINSVDRRVPLVRKYDGTNPGRLLTPRYDLEPQHPPTDGFFSYGHLTSFNTSKPFCEVDSTVRELSDHIRRVHIRPGVTWQTRIGNLFKNVIVKNLSLNLYYDATLKGSDTVGFYDPLNDGFNRAFLEENTNQYAHRIGSTIHYQFDDIFRLNAGFQHLFAGKNVMQFSDFFIGFNADF